MDDGERTRRAGEQDRFGERAMHRHREAGQVLLHQTSAPPPKLKKERKKELAAKATDRPKTIRSEEHTSELQSLMRISYAVFYMKKKQLVIRHSHETLT